MRDVQKLRDLLERVEKASGPNRKLDRELNGLVDSSMDQRFYHLLEFPSYTASLDASIALVERMLPGWVYELYGPSEMSRALALLKPEVSRRLWQARGATMPLAILSALLSALISQAEGEGHD